MWSGCWMRFAHSHMHVHYILYRDENAMYVVLELPIQFMMQTCSHKCKGIDFFFLLKHSILRFLISWIKFIHSKLLCFYCCWSFVLQFFFRFCLDKKVFFFYKVSSFNHFHHWSFIVYIKWIAMPSHACAYISWMRLEYGT